MKYESLNKDQLAVADKIIRMCESRDIIPPMSWDRATVEKIADEANNTCPFCKKLVGHGTEVICSCELSHLNFNN